MNGDVIRKDILWRVNLLMIVFIILGVSIIGRVAYIQTAKGSQYRAMSDSLSTRMRTIDAIRGNILAEDGRLLATSIPIYDLRMDMTIFPIDTFNKVGMQICRGLSKIFPEKTADEYFRTFVSAHKRNETYFLLKRDVSYIDLQEVKKLPIFEKGRYKSGLIEVQKNVRKMPFGKMAYRTIGSIKGKNYFGLEGAYDNYLKGTTGKCLMQRVTGGVWMPVDDEKQQFDPLDGKDIVTTLNVNFQDVAETALEKRLAMHHAEAGCAIVMEVATGKIVAMANLGHEKDEDPYYENNNYAVSSSLEPGSTIKLASLMAGFEDGLFDLQTKTDFGHGTAIVAGQELTDAHDYGANGTVKKAFGISSNIGIASLIYRVYRDKPQRFIDQLRRFRLGSKSGIDLLGEPKPFLKDVKHSTWSRTSLPWISYGYEMTITPLQLLSFYNAVANRGTYMKPYLVSEIRSFGTVVKKFEPTVLASNLFKQKTLDMTFEMMKMVVDSGTANNIRSKEYTIAGKTGTARVYNDPIKDGKKRYRASFCGFFPVENPKYSCMVLIINPQGSLIYGSQLAAPVFREISDVIMAWEALREPVYKSEMKYTPNFELIPGNRLNTVRLMEEFEIPAEGIEGGDWVAVLPDTVRRKQKVSILPLEGGKMPNVIGMGLSDALFLLESRGFRVTIQGKGVVKQQSIEPGAKVRPGERIQLTLN